MKTQGRSELGLKIDSLKKPDTFSDEQWQACGELVKTIRVCERDAISHGNQNFPKFTFEVLAAFRTCPRHIFCHPQHAHEGYEDRARPISCDQVISQPSLVAMMTGLLEVKKGDKVLEIGTGSGYQAGILASMGVNVYTIEIFEQLYNEATPKLNQLYPTQVRCERGDGFKGWTDAAPFDAIVVTAGIDKVPQAFVDQIKMGGNIAIPIEVGGNQRGHILINYKKTPQGLTRREISGCCFVPFTREDNKGNIYKAS